MAAANLYIYNETKKAVKVTSSQTRMTKAPPTDFTVQPSSPYNQIIQATDQTSSFTLAFDSTNVVTTKYDATSKEYSITPTSNNDATIGALVAPTTINSVNVDILNYLVGDGEPVTYLNGLLAALIPPAVVQLNKTGPHPFSIKGFTLTLQKLDLSASNLSCTYASRQGTGEASFNMQAIISLTTVGATIQGFGDITLTDIAALVFLKVDPSKKGSFLEVESMQFSLQGAGKGLPGFISELAIAQALNSAPTNGDMIKAINEKFRGGFGAELVAAPL